MAFRRDTHHHRSRLGRGAIATLALTLAVGTAAPLAANAAPVSYTHLTLPTSDLV